MMKSIPFAHSPYSKLQSIPAPTFPTNAGRGPRSVVPREREGEELHPTEHIVLIIAVLSFIFFFLNP